VSGTCGKIVSSRPLRLTILTSARQIGRFRTVAVAHPCHATLRRP
jgi:hypothetical protein